MTAGPASHPPVPRLALAVGVIGHRPGKRLPEDAQGKVARDVDMVLALIAAAARKSRDDHRIADDTPASREHKSMFSGEEPVLSVVSALAEGADTIVAQAARARPGKDYELDAPLPFFAEVYRKDFSPEDAPAGAPDTDAQKTFAVLLGQARAKLQLPGVRGPADGDERKRAYEAAGVTVLSQSDIVIAIWDRGPSQGRGGTTEMVEAAARAGIPIVHIDSMGSKPVTILWRGLMEYPAAIDSVWDLTPHDFAGSISQVIDQVIRLPAEVSERRSFARYRRESRRRWNLRPEFPLLMAVLGVRRFKRSDVRPYSPEDLSGDYAGWAMPAADEFRESQGRSVARAFGWADATANYYGQMLRSAFILNFLVAAIAVGFASASVLKLTHGVSGHEPAGLPELLSENWLILVEILLIALIVGNTMAGMRRQWHRRWLEAREVAERLRIALPLWALGLQPATFSGAEPTWTGWYARAFVRTQTLRDARLDETEMSAARQILIDLLAGQCAYNDGAAKRMRKMLRRLEMFGVGLFAATALVALDHLTGGHVLTGALRARPTAEVLSIWLSVALPALASAVYGIRLFGDLETLERRAERTHADLDRLIKAIKDDALDLTVLRARARAASDIMLGDVASWRVATESRGLDIPG